MTPDRTSPASAPDTPAATTESRKRWTGWLRLGLGLALLAAAVATADLRGVWELVTSLDPLLGIATLLLYVVERSVMAYKWEVLLRARRIGIGFREALRLYLVSGILSNVTPGGIGGDVYRVIALAGARSKSAVAATVIVERLLGAVGTGACAAITLPAAAAYFGLTSAAATGPVVALVAACLVAFLLPLHAGSMGWLDRIPLLRGGRLREKLDVFLAAYREPGAHSGSVAFLALTVLDVIVMIAVDVVAARALGIDASWLFFLVVSPAIQFLSRLPITLGGLGVQEGLYVVALTHAGFTAEAAVAFALLRLVIPFAAAHLPGAILWWLMPSRPRPIESQAR
jgi:uncharacterized protein (TIRG00374 family)